MIVQALKARNCEEFNHYAEAIARLQRSEPPLLTTWAVGPGFYMSRLWRSTCQAAGQRNKTWERQRRVM